MKNSLAFFALLLFSSIGFAQEQVKFQAKIENRNGDVLFLQDNGKTIQEIKLDSNNEFKAQFSVNEGMYQLFDGVEYAQLFLKNGFDLKMTMNATQFDETIKFEGKGSKENNFLAAETLAEEALEINKWIALDQESFDKVVSQKKADDLAKLNQAGLDPYFTKIQTSSIENNLKMLQQFYTQISANKKMNNTKAPNFDYENASGGKTSLESLKGKYVYIDIWATWCGPCRAEIPFLKKVEDKFQNKNIAFVSISVDVDKDHDKWKNFVKEKELGGIQLFADKNWLSDFIKAFNINSIPRFILIDPTGTVIDADAARPSDPKLFEQLAGLLQ